MTKAESSRVAQPGAGKDRHSAQPGGDAKPVVPNLSATLVIDHDSDAGSWAQHLRDTEAMRVR